MLKHLKKKFSLSEAEEYYGVNYFKTSTPTVPQSPQTVEDFTLSPLFRASPSIKRLRNESPLGEAIPQFLSLFKGQMSSKMQFQLVNHLFKLMIEQKHGLSFLHFLHGDCMEVVTNGILALHKAGKENIVYRLAHVFGKNKMDMQRMPFGLIDYNIRFFNAESTANLKMEEHYALWQETMFAHFGHKWVSLNRGPMWQYDEEEEEVKEKDAVQSCDILAEALSSAGIDHEINESVNSGNKDDYSSGESLEFGPEFASVSVDDDLSLEEASYMYSADATSVTGDEVSPSVCEVHLHVREESDAGCVPEKGVDTRSVAESAALVSEEGRVPAVSPDCEEAVSVSTLWTSLTRDERDEIVESHADPALFERLHGIVPQNHPTKKHSGLYKPEKVCGIMMLIVLFYLQLWLHQIEQNIFSSLFECVFPPSPQFCQTSTGFLFLSALNSKFSPKRLYTNNPPPTYKLW